MPGNEPGFISPRATSVSLTEKLMSAKCCMLLGSGDLEKMCGANTCLSGITSVNTDLYCALKISAIYFGPFSKCGLVVLPVSLADLFGCALSFQSSRTRRKILETPLYWLLLFFFTVPLCCI